MTTITSVDVKALRRSNIKKISVTQVDKARFSRCFPAAAHTDEAHRVYFTLASDVDRLKFYNFLAVEQLRDVDKLGEQIIEDARRIDSMYVDWCNERAAKRLARPRRKS